MNLNFLNSERWFSEQEDALETFSSHASSTHASPSKKVRKREKEKISTYLQHAKKQKTNPLFEKSDEIYEMLLLTSWRCGDVEWTEDLLDKVSMDSDSVFSLLKEALVAGDDIFVSDLICEILTDLIDYYFYLQVYCMRRHNNRFLYLLLLAIFDDLIGRGANLEREVPKRGAAAAGGDGESSTGVCWETVLHHCAMSLPLKSNGSVGPLVRLVLDTGRAFLDRRDQEGHTPLSLAVVEGNMSMIRMLVNEYNAGLDFDVCSTGLPFRQWAVESKAEGRVRPGFESSDEIEEVSLVLRALLSMREDVKKESTGGAGGGGGRRRGGGTTKGEKSCSTMMCLDKRRRRRKREEIREKTR